VPTIDRSGEQCETGARSTFRDRATMPWMIDHLSLGVADLARAAAFYDAVLVTLGYVRVFTHERAVGYGRPGDRDEQLALLASGDKVISDN